MSKITYRTLTDPDDPIFKRGVISSNPDPERDRKIAAAKKKKRGILIVREVK